MMIAARVELVARARAPVAGCSGTGTFARSGSGSLLPHSTLSVPASLSRLFFPPHTLYLPRVLLSFPEYPTMPSEQSLLTSHEQSQSDLPQSQIKYCSCLANDQLTQPIPFFQPGQDNTDSPTLICPSCGSCMPPSPRTDLDQQPEPETDDDLLEVAESQRNLRRWAAALHDGDNEANERHTHSIHQHTHSSHEQSLHDEMDIEAPTPLSSRPDALRADPHAPASQQQLHTVSSSSSPGPLSIVTSHLSPAYSTHNHNSHAPAPSPSSPVASSSRQRQSRPFPPPDPRVDITRIRVRSRGHHCLYPGATFQGTQKSGRNSYDVNVTIVVRGSCLLLL